MSDFCSPDNPYDPKARMARDAVRSHRSAVIDAGEEDQIREREPKDWAPRPLGSNYPRELIDLATEEDSCLRYDIRQRQNVRTHLVAAGLSTSVTGIPTWERDLLDRQNEQAREERVDANRARRRADRN